MRRLLYLLLVLVCMMTLFGCGKEPGEGLIDEKGQVYFNAIVLETNEDSVVVKCTQAFDSGISVDEELSVSTNVVASKGAPEMTIDDNIRVVFNGEIMESDPLKLGTVFAIYLLDENGEVIPND